MRRSTPLTLALATLVTLFALAPGAVGQPAEPQGRSVPPAVALGAFPLFEAISPTAPCPRPDFYCLDVWDPVICDDGRVHSNACYAKRACATGCVPLGGQTL